MHKKNIFMKDYLLDYEDLSIGHKQLQGDLLDHYRIIHKIIKDDIEL